MATLVVSATANNTTEKQILSVLNTSVTRTGTNEQHGRITVGTSEETLAVIADVTPNLGYVMLVNRDATNYVQVGIATASYFARLKPGRPTLFEAEPGVATWYLKADTASCELEYHFWEL